MKVCTKCRISKPPSDFYRDSRTADGLRTRCKLCQRETSRAWRHANRDRHNAYQRKYRRENRDKISASAKANYEKNKPQRLAYMSAYQRAHPEFSWVSLYRRRAIQYGYEPIVEKFTKRDVIELYGAQCYHCGGAFEHLDHWPTPTAHGGTHTLDNVRPACAKCNTSQGAWARDTRKQLAKERP